MSMSGNYWNLYNGNIAENNRLKMIESYFALNNPINFYDNEEAKRRGLLNDNFNKNDRDILNEINYNDIESMKIGLDRLSRYIKSVENYYKDKFIDPETVDECKKLWIKYNELEKKILYN